MNRKIFSAYVGLDFESMHLNSDGNNNMRRWETIAESENVCHDNLNSFLRSSHNQEWANYTNMCANMLCGRPSDAHLFNEIILIKRACIMLDTVNQSNKESSRIIKLYIGI